VRGRVAAWFVLQEAARHVKVVVDGEGGDELLAGYSRCVFPYLVDRVRRGPARLGLLRELPRLGEIESRSRLWFLAHTPLAPAKRALGLPPWPGRGVAATRIPRRRWSARERPYASALNNLLWHELRRDGLPEVLHLTDAISMAFSVESRPPFLDHRVAELCLSLPFHEKIAGGVTKSVLRRALEGVVPPEILDRRRKMGFPAPLRRYLALPENRRDVEALLLDRRTLERGVFDPRRLERALRAGPSPGRVWRWVTLELWFRDFVDRPPEV
jgi:asparagine synthase (glutamine-hydrolysing)